MPTILFSSYSGLFGGAERVLLDCAAAIEGRHLLACPEGALARQARAAGILVLPLPERRLNLRAGARDRVAAPVRLLAHARELRRLGRDLDPDLIVAWGMRSAIACAAAGHGRRMAVAHHDFLPSGASAAVVRAAIARASLVTVPSEAVAEDLDPGGELAERLVIVRPGVDPERFADVGPVPEVPSLLVLGAIAGWKRPDLALDICSIARRSLPELTVRLVGAPVTSEDTTLEELRDLASVLGISTAVEIVGARADPHAELERCACLLHCAPREPFGIVLLEAMAAGRPVVAPDAAGPREILNPEVGVLYPAQDARAGAAAVVELLSDRRRMVRMGRSGRDRVRSGFDRAATRRGFAAALSPLLRTAHPALAADQLALVTVTHNSSAALEALIESVARHLPGAGLTVVDCASTDDSVAVAAAHPSVQIVELGKNLGFGRAVNRGLQTVSAPVVALLNPDVELVDASILALAAEALRTDRPERLLAPLLLNQDGTRQQSAHPFPGGAADLLRVLVPPGLVPGFAGVPLAPWRSRGPRRVGWAIGAALVARATTFRRLGPFDEKIFMYGEDMELGLRAREQGIETWFWPSGRALHSGAHSTDQAYGGEPFQRLAQARHDTVTNRLGARRARLDDAAQGLTFAFRVVLKSTLGRGTERERRQLAAVRWLAR